MNKGWNECYSEQKKTYIFSFSFDNDLDVGDDGVCNVHDCITISI